MFASSSGEASARAIVTEPLTESGDAFTISPG